LRYLEFINIRLKMEKVLIRGVNWIGDAVMSMPFITGLGRAWPEAEIHILTRPHLAELYKYNPHVKSVIQVNDKNRISGWKAAIKKTKEMRFNISICLPHSFSSALFLFLSRVSIRYGRACSGRSILFTHPVYGKIEDYAAHQSDFYLEMLEAISGCRTSGRLPEIHISDTERHRASVILEQSKSPVLGIFCSAAYGPAKVWPRESFAELGRQYILKTGGSVVLFGGALDYSANNSIASSIGSRALNIAGMTSLLESVAVMENCNAVVANDSGPMHLAAASGTKTVGIFGSTNPARTAPLGKNATYITKNLACAPCMARVCRLGTYECLKSINPEDVLKEIAQI
jgi:heptosyltransferase-2